MVRVVIRQIVLIGGGALIASPMLLKKWPKLLDAINKVAGYKNAIGISALLLGGIDLLSILMLTPALASEHYSDIIIFISAAFELTMGFLLGYNITFANWFKSNAKALHSSQNMYGRLIKHQTLIGISAIGWAVVLMLLYV